MNDLSYTIKQERVFFSVVAIPKASQNKVDGIRNSALLVRVQAAPEDGKANTAIVSLLAKALKLPKSEIRIEHGQTNRHKTFSIPESGLASLQKLGGIRLSGSESTSSSRCYSCKVNSIMVRFSQGVYLHDRT